MRLAKPLWRSVQRNEHIVYTVTRTLSLTWEIHYSSVLRKTSAKKILCVNVSKTLRQNNSNNFTYLFECSSCKSFESSQVLPSSPER